MTALQDFRDSLNRPDVTEALAAGVIGNDMPFETPFGTKRLIYADYTASGRALAQVEAFVAGNILPFYANSHTEASFCGMTMTRMREEARATIASLVNAGPDGHVIFGGSGATAGINLVVRLLRIKDRIAAGEDVVVINSIYEHHSNILPWRESGARVLTIPAGATGGVDLAVLEETLKAEAGAALIVGTFSAASNVTGLITDPDPVTRLLKAHGALSIWDYAGGGPYLPMDMTPSADCAKDAIIFSPHKFVGGPAATGVAVIRDTIVDGVTSTAPGGGTVSFVSPWRHAYSRRVEAREEAGTPNVIGDIRAALAMLVKDAVGIDRIIARDHALRAEGVARLANHPNIRLLGPAVVEGALPIFSFQIRDDAGAPVHHQLFTRMLSDIHGVQVRGGCACAGPYGHELLGLDEAASDTLFARLEDGHEIDKPGWVRLNLSYVHTDEQVARILDAVTDLAANVSAYSARYTADPSTARFTAQAS